MLLPVNKTNAWDQTYSMLKQAILTRQFQPDEKLSIPELSEQLGVSRTPIRDALHRLEMEGLLRTVAKVGTFVNGIRQKEIENTVESRLMIDWWVADYITYPVDAGAIDELASILNSDNDDRDGLFHLRYVGLSGNERLVDFYQQLMYYRIYTIGSAFVTEAMYTRAAKQHSAILEAVRKGSKDELKQAIKTHLDFSKTNLLAALHHNGGVL